VSSTLSIPTPRVYVPLLGKGRYKGAFGGRGSGKSHFFAELLIERCIAEPDTRAVCVREIQKSLDQSVKQLLEDKIKALGVGSYFEVLDTEIHLLDDNGKRAGRIIFQGMQNHTAESIKSLEGYNLAWVEEAQSLSQRSLDLLRPTIRSPGSELWFSWNPKRKTDPVDVLLRGEHRPPSAVVVKANFTDNPWLPEELRADLEWDRERDLDKYRHVWLGEYQTISKATVFRNWKVEEFTAPADAIHRFGADWGFSVDPSVLIRCHIIGRKLYVDQEAYKVGCEIDETPALFAGNDTQAPPRWTNEKQHRGIPGALTWTIRADSARPETVSYMQRRGFKIIPAVKGPGSLEDGVEFLKTYDIIVHPRCTHTVDELTSYSFKTDPLTDEVLPVLEDKKNHVIDALRYACEGLRRAAKPSKPEQSRNPPDLWGRPKQQVAGWKVA
jgi:phage terminase large subunit